jgi:hypothetical protein
MKGFQAVFWMSLVSSPCQTLSQDGGYLGGIGYVYYDCLEEIENECLDNGGICSQDGVCLPKTCENVYRYSYYSRSRDEIGAQQQDATLECYVNEFPPNNVVKPPCGGGGVFPMAVYYTCGDELWIDGIQLPCPRFESYGDRSGVPATPLFVSMNRVCTAKPSPNERFICYDIAPDTDLTSYFDDYLAAVEPYARCEEDHESGVGSSDFNNMTNTTFFGHTIVAGHVTISGLGMGSTFFANLYTGDNFDPMSVAASAFATVLIDNTSSSTSSQHNYGTGVLSSILFVILSVSIMIIE